MSRPTFIARRGFTLVELLIVIGIIAMIIIMITPALQKSVVRAKDQAVKSNCAAIEAGLATFAQRNGGTYPGLAVDVMAPFGDTTQILGDPALTVDNAPQYADMGFYGVLGDFGHRNYNSTQSVGQQLDVARATVLSASNMDYPRIFDTLVATDSLQEYPANPFSGSTISRAGRMRNIYGTLTNVTNLTDTHDPAQMNDLAIDFPWLMTTNQGAAAGGFANVYFYQYSAGELAWDLGQLPLTLPIDPATFDPQAFSEACAFGVDEGDYFAEGNFAYVPLLSTSVFPMADDVSTLRNEKFQWGSRVTSYLIFGYGSREGRSNNFPDEQAGYVKVGLPGYGSAGIDTRAEEVVLQLFEGAVYFNKVGL
jgi:prepilin-type N-terminal cleavage/methylation domain-containing protein